MPAPAPAKPIPSTPGPGTPTHPRAGHRYTTLCTDTIGRTGTHTVTAERVDWLGCGCWRISTVRPGPQSGRYIARMELLTGCGMHGPDDLAAEPAAVVEG